MTPLPDAVDSPRTTVRFDLELPEPRTRRDAMYPRREHRRSWSHAQLIGVLPGYGLRILDVGAGRSPLRVRPQDELVTVDFEAEADPSVTSNVASSWPFGEEEFDLIYMSHVLEHFYPEDRDSVIRSAYASLRPGGMLFIRVPHKSSYQAVGWEHYSFFGLSGVTGLCHGHNPMLPMLRLASVGASMTIDFYAERSPLRRAIERALSRYWQLTDVLLCHLVLGIPEVQFMLLRMDPATEHKLRASSSAYVV